MADPAPGQPATWTLMDFTAEDQVADQLAQALADARPRSDGEARLEAALHPAQPRG